MERGKKWQIAAAVAVVAIGVEMISYLFLAEGGMIRTVERYLPQYTHYRDARFRWVCVGDRTTKSLSAGQRARMECALNRHFETVYWERDDIPATYLKWCTDSDGRRRLSGVQHGCIIEWSVVSRGPLWFTGSFRDWEGSAASMGREVTFVWLFGRWWKVWTHGTVIS